MIKSFAEEHDYPDQFLYPSESGQGRQVEQASWPLKNNSVYMRWLEMKRENARKKKLFKSANEVMVTIHVQESLSSESISNLYENIPDKFKDIVRIRGHRTKF